MTKAGDLPNPNDYIITRKRKLYKFAAFKNLPNCFTDDTWPEQRTTFLNQPGQLVVEVGAGSGLFLTELAKRHSEQKFIAIDRKSDRLYKGAKLANELGLTNIIYLWSNARNLATLLPADSVTSLWLTFPDPWPQESNIKHRLTNQHYLKPYYQLLVSGGQFNFKTDNLPLFTWSLDQIDKKNWQIVIVTNNLHQDEQINTLNDAMVMTSYEQRYVNEGKAINYLLAIKNN